jgi:hypothetical protein
LLLALVAACGGGQRRSVLGADADDAIVYVDSKVKDAGLWVDGRLIGGVGMLKGGVAIDAGTHRIEVKHDDYFSYYALLELKAGERRRLKVELAPVLP